MGFLDRAKQLAEQAMSKAEEALAEVRAKAASPGTNQGPATTAPSDPRMGTPYVPGTFGRPGWREQGLVDPAAVLPIDARDRAGVPHSTKSQVVEEPFGFGRRWSSGGRSVGLFYQLYPEHLSWAPPGGKTPLPDVPGALGAALPDGRSLVFLSAGQTHVVLELHGLDAARPALADAVKEQLAAS